MRAIALVLATLLLPVALADHVYSHRYIIEGRLVGANGAPLPGRDVELVTQNVSFSETCHDGGHLSVTDDRGDFRFCFHTHALPPDGRIGVRSGEANATALVDGTLRRSTFMIRDPSADGVAPAGWNESYRVGGRLWRPGPTQLEGVSVYGLAIAHAPVNLTVRTSDGGTTRFETTTDAYGDFDLGITTAADPAEVTLIVEAFGQGQPAALDEATHRTSVALSLAPEGGARVATGAALGPAPGSATPRASPILLVAVAAGLALSIGIARRKS